MRRLLLALLLPVSAVAQAPEPAIHLVYSGGLRGLGRGSSLFELQERLAPTLEGAGRTVERVDVTHAILAQGEHEIWPLDGRIDSALAYAAAPPTCDDGQVVTTAVTPTERFVAVPGSLVLPVADARLEPRRWQLCEAGGVRAIALGPPDASAADLTLTHPSLRTGFRWVAGAESWLQIGRPRREPGRRLGLIRQALSAGPNARFADAGDFVDPGHDATDTDWLAARQLSFDTLESLSPVALAIGASELALGPAALAAEAAARNLPYVATNWSAESLPFPTHLVKTVPFVDRPRTVVFVGITDPEVVPRVPELAAEGVTLLDPVASVHAVVDPLRASTHPPDLVVLLGNLSPELQADLRRRLHGVDLLVGDPSAATFRVRQAKTAFHPTARAFKAAPLTLPLDGVAAARIVLGDDGAHTVSVSPLQVTAESAEDPTLTAAVSSVRARTDRSLDSPLIPPTSPLEGVPFDRWSKLVCESLLDRTGAEIAFLAGLRFSRPTPGPLTELQVAERLSGGHVVEVHNVDGDRLNNFLDAAHGLADVQCGAPTGRVMAMVQGRFVNPNRTYRVVTTDISRRQTRLAELLEHASSDLVGHLPKYRALRNGERPLTLSDAVRGALKAKQGAGEGWVEELLARNPSRVQPQLLLDVSRISFRLVRFEGARTDAYGSVPETLLNSPSSFTLGGDLNVALQYSGPKAVWELRTTAAYTRFAIDGLPPQETADDWTVATSLDLPVAAFPPNLPFHLRPFVELKFDSEFTPADHDGTALPLQSDLSVYGGLAGSPRPWLRRLRLGPFINRDLARLDDKATEFGGRFVGSTFHSPLPRFALFITTNWDVQVFAPTTRDDAADLRLRMFGEARLGVRIIRHLRLAAFVNGLLVQGRVPETSEVAGAVTVGVSLDLAASLRLDSRRPLGL